MRSTILWLQSLYPTSHEPFRMLLKVALILPRDHTSRIVVGERVILLILLNYFTNDIDRSRRCNKTIIITDCHYKTINKSSKNLTKGRIVGVDFFHGRQCNVTTTISLEH